jgi:hypothetical protein
MTRLHGYYRNKSSLQKEVKPTVRQVECEDACLIFDDTIQEKQSKWA